MLTIIKCSSSSFYFACGNTEDPLSLWEYGRPSAVVTNSMHLRSTYAPYLQNLQSEAPLESSRTSAVELFEETINVLTLIRVGFLGVRFEVGGEGGEVKLHPVA